MRSSAKRTTARDPLAAVGRWVRRAPVSIAAAMVLVTVAMAVLSQDGQVATNTDGMAPDNPQVAAATELTERFGADTEEVVQLLVTHQEGSVVGRDGLAAATAIETTIRDSDVAPLLADTVDRPAVLTWSFPVQLGLDGTPTATDQQVRTAYATAMATLPADAAGLAARLLPDGATLETADSALALVFLDPSSLPEDDAERWEALSAAQVDLVADLERADLPDGMTVEAFSPHLLFAGGDDFDAELGRLMISAFTLILVILGFVYWTRPGRGMTRARSARRSAADTALTLGAIVMAIIWMQGLGVLLGPGYLGVIGATSQFAQVIPVLLIGLGVDYAIHLTSRYREEVGGGATVADGVTGAIGSVGAALLLATVATAVGFLTNIVNPIPDLQDFGILAAAGIISASVVMLTFVPAIRFLLDRRAERTGRLPAAPLAQTSERLLPDLVARTAVLAKRMPVFTLAVTVALGAVGAFGLTHLEVRFSNTDAVPEDSPVLATLEAITEGFGGGFGETTEVLITGDIATPAVHNAVVEAHANLADLDDVVRLQGEPAAESVVTVLGQLLAGDQSDPVTARVAAAARGAGVRADLTVPDDSDVAALYAELEAASPEVVGSVIDRTGDGGVSRVSLQSRAGEADAADLSAGLDVAFAPVTAAGATAVATSGPIIVDVIVQAMRDSQVTSLAITLLAVMALLVGVFGYQQRRPLLGVITVAPVVFVVLWTFGMMALTGVPFGPITATIAALAIGIGLPYAIHVTHRFVEDHARLGDIDAAITSTVRHTGGAMTGSAFTTMAGFGILVTSSMLPFRQLGQVTAYAVGFSLVAATLVQPSLLVLWARWHVRRDEPQPLEPVRDGVDPVDGSLAAAAAMPAVRSVR